MTKVGDRRRKHFFSRSFSIKTVFSVKILHCKIAKKLSSAFLYTGMEAPMKFIFLLGLLVIVSNDWAKSVDGASACGKSTPDNEAFKLAPCAAAAADEAAAVSDSCCLQVKRIGQNPSCLCAVMLSNTAKISGINPEIAITIPKRCNIATRPVGYKCGPYTLP